MKIVNDKLTNISQKESASNTVSPAAMKSNSNRKKKKKNKQNNNNNDGKNSRFETDAFAV